MLPCSLVILQGNIVPVHIKTLHFAKPGIMLLLARLSLATQLFGSAECFYLRPELLTAKHIAFPILLPRCFQNSLWARRIGHKQPLDLVLIVDADLAGFAIPSCIRRRSGGGK